MPSNYSAPPTLADEIGDLTIANFASAAVQLSSEAFTDSNTIIQTAAAVDDRIEAKGYLTTSSATSTYAPIASPTFTGTVTTPNHANVDSVLTSVASKAPIASPTFTGTVAIPSYSDVASTLGTISAKAPIDAPTFTGTVAIPGFSNVATTLGEIATNASAISAITNGAPSLLNTLDELAAAINDDENFSTTITALIDSKASSANPTFTGTPNLSEGFSIGGTAVTSTAAELNILDGVTSTAAELNLVDGSAAGTIANSKALIYGAGGQVNATTLQIGGASITASVAELNILDGMTSTTAELNILDGVTATSAEINKVAGLTATAAELNIMDGVTATTGEINLLDGVTATTTELNKLDGFTGSASDLNFAKDLAATGVTASELDILDGNTSATSTTIAAGDRIVYNDDGTMKQVAISDLVTH